MHKSGVEYHRNNYALWDDATRTLELHVRKKLSNVNLDFAVEGLSVFGVLPSPITYAQSFSCPDLLSAIYLQFYLLMTGALPLKICGNPNCRVAFEASRKDKKYCTAGCRSSGRPSRRRRNS